MPFDATQFTSIGIVPIPDEYAYNHKRAFEKKWARFSFHRHYLLRSKRAHWHRIPVCVNDLTHNDWTAPSFMIPPAPQAVIDLARIVDNHPLEMEAFDTDPILWMRKEVGGRRFCIAIWDETGLIALAGREGQQPMLPQKGFFKRLLTSHST